MPESALEAKLAQQIEYARAAGSQIPEPVREYRFDPSRRWRLDFYWSWIEKQPSTGNRSRLTTKSLAVEVEGATRSGGRHTRGQGFEDDCRKYNEASLAGIILLRVTGEMVRSGEALRLIQRAFGDPFERGEWNR